MLYATICGTTTYNQMVDRTIPFRYTLVPISHLPRIEIEPVSPSCRCCRPAQSPERSRHRDYRRSVQSRRQSTPHQGRQYRHIVYIGGCQLFTASVRRLAIPGLDERSLIVGHCSRSAAVVVLRHFGVSAVPRLQPVTGDIFDVDGWQRVLGDMLLRVVASNAFDLFPPFGSSVALVVRGDRFPVEWLVPRRGFDGKTRLESAFVVDRQPEHPTVETNRLVKRGSWFVLDHVFVSD